jgi:hypothetical protein
VTQKELQALLKRARDELQVIASYMDIPNHEWPNVGLKMTARAYKRMVATIDAALAEPTAECQECSIHKAFHDVAMAEKRMTEFHLNEARAEIQRLQQELKRSAAHWEERWFVCHDGSENACCKSHEGDD